MWDGAYGRFDYQPLLRDMKLACTNRSGIIIFFGCEGILWPGRFEVYSAFKVGNIQDFDNEKCSRSWRKGIVSFSTAWVRKLHWFSSWRQGQNTAFKSIAIAIFSSDFANVRASKIPQDQLKVLMSLLVAKRGGRWGRPRAEAAEDIFDDSPDEFKLTLII